MLEKTSGYSLSSTVQKALSILECIAQFQPITASGIQTKLGLNKSSVHRLLATLRLKGYITRIEQGFVITLKMYALGISAPNGKVLIDITLPYMDSLRSKIHYDISLQVVNNDYVVRINQLEYNRSFFEKKTREFIFPINCSATGKLYLAHLPNPELYEALDSIDIVKRTDYSLTEREELIKEIQVVRIKGYSIEMKEFNRLTHCIAAPVYSYNREFIGALAVTGPSTVLTQQAFNYVLPDLLKTADTISKKLGNQQ